MIERRAAAVLRERLHLRSGVVLLGRRQVGKTTPARRIGGEHAET